VMTTSFQTFTYSLFILILPSHLMMYNLHLWKSVIKLRISHSPLCNLSVDTTPLNKDKCKTVDSYLE